MCSWTLVALWLLYCTSPGSTAPRDVNAQPRLLTSHEAPESLTSQPQRARSQSAWWQRSSRDKRDDNGGGSSEEEQQVVREVLSEERENDQSQAEESQERTTRRARQRQQESGEQQHRRRLYEDRPLDSVMVDESNEWQDSQEEEESHDRQVQRAMRRGQLARRNRRRKFFQEKHDESVSNSQSQEEQNSLGEESQERMTRKSSQRRRRNHSQGNEDDEPKHTESAESRQSQEEEESQERLKQRKFKKIQKEEAESENLQTGSFGTRQYDSVETRQSEERQDHREGRSQERVAHEGGGQEVKRNESEEQTSHEAECSNKKTCEENIVSNDQAEQTYSRRKLPEDQNILLLHEPNDHNEVHKQSELENSEKKNLTQPEITQEKLDNNETFPLRKQRGLVTELLTEPVKTVKNDHEAENNTSIEKVQEMQHENENGTKDENSLEKEAEGIGMTEVTTPERNYTSSQETQLKREDLEADISQVKLEERVAGIETQEVTAPERNYTFSQGTQLKREEPEADIGPTIETKANQEELDDSNKSFQHSLESANKTDILTQEGKPQAMMSTNGSERILQDEPTAREPPHQTEGSEVRSETQELLETQIPPPADDGTSSVSADDEKALNDEGHHTNDQVATQPKTTSIESSAEQTDEDLLADRIHYVQPNFVVTRLVHPNVSRTANLRRIDFSRDIMGMSRIDEPRTLLNTALGVLTGLHMGIGGAPTSGKFTASNTMSFLGKVINTDFTITYGTPVRTPIPAHVPALFPFTPPVYNSHQHQRPYGNLLAHQTSDQTPELSGSLLPVNYRPPHPEASYVYEPSASPDHRPPEHGTPLPVSVSLYHDPRPPGVGDEYIPFPPYDTPHTGHTDYHGLPGVDHNQHVPPHEPGIDHNQQVHPHEHQQWIQQHANEQQRLQHLQQGQHHQQQQQQEQYHLEEVEEEQQLEQYRLQQLQIEHQRREHQQQQQELDQELYQDPYALEDLEQDNHDRNESTVDDVTSTNSSKETEESTTTTSTTESSYSTSREQEEREEKRPESTSQLQIGSQEGDTSPEGSFEYLDEGSFSEDEVLNRVEKHGQRHRGSRRGSHAETGDDHYSEEVKDSAESVGS